MSDPTVSIGEAAALYGLTPATLRWWERQKVVAQPARDGGRRIYSDADLRRIGLAYLCCVVGKMPLDQAAVVTSGKVSHGMWQRTVGEQITSMGQRIEQLEAAKDYLRHLLYCRGDDMAECLFLDGELSTHTPRGRVSASDLIGAARAAGGVRQEHAEPPVCDEIQSDRRPGDETPSLCTCCRAPMARAYRGRPRKYCSRACQQRVYRARQDGRVRSEELTETRG